MTQLNLKQGLFNRYGSDTVTNTNSVTNQDVTAIYNSATIVTGIGSDQIVGVANLLDSLVSATTTTTTSACGGSYSCGSYDTDFSATGVWNNGGSITFGSGVDLLSGTANVTVTGANKYEVDSIGFDNYGCYASVVFGDGNDQVIGNSNITVNVDTTANLLSTGIENYKGTIKTGGGTDSITGNSVVTLSTTNVPNIFAVGIDNHYGTIIMGGCSGDDQIIGTSTIGTSGGGIIPDAVVASPATTSASPSCTTTTTTTSGCGSGSSTSSGCGDGSYTPPLNASVDTIGLENYSGTIALGNGNDTLSGIATINGGANGAVGIYNTGSISLGNGTDTVSGIASVTGGTYALGLYNSGTIAFGTGADTLIARASITGLAPQAVTIDGGGTITMSGTKNYFSGFGNQTVLAGSTNNYSYCGGYSQNTTTNQNTIDLSFVTQASMGITLGSSYNNTVAFNYAGAAMKTSGFNSFVFADGTYTYSQLKSH